MLRIISPKNEKLTSLSVENNQRKDSWKFCAGGQYSGLKNRVL